MIDTLFNHGGDDTAVALDVELTVDTALALMRADRRRNTLRSIAAYTEDADQVSFRTVAEHVAAAEYNKSMDDVTQREYRRLYVSLRQTHLPTLEDYDIITVDDNNTIHADDTVHQLVALLDLVDDACAGDDA